MTSPEFLITGELLTLLVVVGTHFLEDPNGAAVVQLDVDGTIEFYATGNNNETMQRAAWNISSFKGRRGVLRITDVNAGAYLRRQPDVRANAGGLRGGVAVER